MATLRHRKHPDQEEVLPKDQDQRSSQAPLEPSRTHDSALGTRAELEPQPARSFWGGFLERSSILVALLLLQSLSGNIIEKYEELLKSNMAVMMFLTTIVGAGGNVGNQSAVTVIRGLATGDIHPGNRLALLAKEAVTGVLIAVVAGAFTAGRIALLSPDTSLHAILAIVTSLVVVVCLSASIGTMLPLLLHAAGLDPAHAGPSIQVVMDILGVFITCMVSSVVLNWA